MAHIHFVTGKGGVGKSYYSYFLSQELQAKKEAPLLNLDLDGDASLLNFHSEKVQAKSIKKLEPLEVEKGLYFIQAKTIDCFNEYLALMLNGFNPFKDNKAKLWRLSLTEKITANAAVRSFVEVCPGLKPIVLLGKLIWEQRNGHAPAPLNTKWNLLLSMLHRAVTSEIFFQAQRLS